MKNKIYKSQVNEILSIIRKKSISNSLIGIDGYGGSGKTTLAAELNEILKGSFVIHMDDFYKLSNLRNEKGNDSEVGFCFDWQRFEKQVLKPFKLNKKISFQRYDWISDKLEEWINVPHNENLIIEGVYSTRRELSDYYDFKIWMSCPVEIRLKRGLERDGCGVKEIWENEWMVQEDDYVKRHNPDLFADVLIDGY